MERVLIDRSKKKRLTRREKIKIVVDFHNLNDLTISDSFPLPNITDILDQLGRRNIFQRCI